jgi:twitching motility protein PilT
MSSFLHNLASEIAKNHGSDIHLQEGEHPIFRIKRRLIRQSQYPQISPEMVQEFLDLLLSEEQIQQLKSGVEQDLAYTFSEGENGYRFRINVYMSQGEAHMAMRYLPSTIKTVEELQLPPVIHQFAQLIRGFVLVTGPTGSGKSTTLAAILNEINHFREEKIVTIEDPIEFIYTPHKSIISQREVGIDSKSFGAALTAAFREDIDVVLLGEMRDLETVRASVTAAETGHLVFSTLHTNSAAQSIDRIIDTFPSSQQPQVRSQLANSLQGIISQRLVPTVDGDLVPAIEIMLMNNAVKSLIRENRIYQIDTVIETHLKDGMMSMNHSLFRLIQKGVVTYETALLYSPDPITLRNMLKRTQI